MSEVIAKMSKLSDMMSDNTDKVLVSACLLGRPCRYDGQSKPVPVLQEWAKTGRLVPVCPEQLGHLPTPRPASGLAPLSYLQKVASGQIHVATPTSELGDTKMSDVGTAEAPAERCDGQAVWENRAGLINRQGQIVTDNYKLGALRALAIAHENGITRAILKQHSPSCGCGSTGGAYPSWQRLAGDGVTTALLKAQGISVITEEDLD